MKKTKKKEAGIEPFKSFIAQKQYSEVCLDIFLEKFETIFALKRRRKKFLENQFAGCSQLKFQNF